MKHLVLSNEAFDTFKRSIWYFQTNPVINPRAQYDYTASAYKCHLARAEVSPTYKEELLKLFKN